MTRIYNYYKKLGYPTEAMGASFRNVGEIVELAGCDLLTISPALLKEPESNAGPLTRKLDPAAASALDVPRIDMDHTTFERMHATDRMASEKLAEGIRGFTKALEATGARLAELEGAAVVAEASEKMFGVYDLDGDGFLNREEWLGTDAVFDAMDADHDGRIDLGELRAGLGAILRLATAA